MPRPIKQHPDRLDKFEKDWLLGKVAVAKPEPPKHDPPKPALSLAQSLKAQVFGQDHAIDKIIPYINLYNANLNPPGRPCGVFMLMGPTGIGKTKTVEALATSLHGDPKQLLRIDCGEFQLDHEVAKLIGAPPGYVGHRETVSRINQAKLDRLRSDYSKLAIILFDEIEKAGPAMMRILLGVLDKATLTLGDNTQVNFQDCLILFTSNIGAKEIDTHLSGGGYGFGGNNTNSNVTKQAELALRKHFLPEFLNRFDELITFNPLSKEACLQIVDAELTSFITLLKSRLYDPSLPCYGPILNYSQETLETIIAQAITPHGGARDIKRFCSKNILQPIAEYITNPNNPIEPTNLNILISKDLKLSYCPIVNPLAHEASEPPEAAF